MAASTKKKRKRTTYALSPKNKQRLVSLSELRGISQNAALNVLLDEAFRRPIYARIFSLQTPQQQG